jgi:Protein of unknown function (DUF2958)
MQLLSEEIKKSLPALYSQESSPNPIAHAKFFTPDAGWTWFVTEGSEEEGDWLLFGYVIGLEEEWGYFLLSEIEGIRGPLGLPGERDLWFQPAPINEVLRRERPQNSKVLVSTQNREQLQESE